ncbi:MAG: FGGY-family carbohydrate kinase [Firmicutes bacterium]|nr:FGGY-family carbohydrate kinase [Bacillota bacterium]
MTYILAYDIGSTSLKTCLFRIDQGIEMIGSTSGEYGLYTLPGGGAEQHMEEWWDAMRRSTKQLMEHAPVEAGEINGISFCSQMQGLVLVDEQGDPVRHPMSYMDQRGKEEMKQGIASGFRIAGMNAYRLLTSLRITGAVSGSVKDPLWKYLWVRNHEPRAFEQARWWLDVKEALIVRMTGEAVMTEDSAYATMLYDTRGERRGWSERLTRMFGVEMRHLPNVIRTTDVAGYLRQERAEELGLAPGTPVFGGGGDASLIGVGAGSVRTGDTHIYCGTSGWVSTIVGKQTVDTGAMIASIIGAQEGKFNYFAEMETAGKCLDWVREHLALDEIGIYLQKQPVTEDPEQIYHSLQEYLSEVIGRAQPGAGGVIFTPWLHGNRCPFEDPNAAGMFFGLRLDTGKTEMIRAVTEGICYHLCWMLECQDKKIRTSQTIRFCGGVANSPVIAQILADITGRTIEVVESPQNAGALGAALTAAVGLGKVRDIESIADVIRVKTAFAPRPEHAPVYRKNYEVFKKLHRQNRKLLAEMA